ncbi:hypothetical protein ACFFX0_30795 [Citricoccus parietis]|uniref:Uncharacterized protein n=1 Tax=Citricoccus parietis TaxID=592307 RepID=A0ABV5G8Q0_9MICC
MQGEALSGGTERFRRTGASALSHLRCPCRGHALRAVRAYCPAPPLCPVSQGGSSDWPV